jgi:hypothetical protein
MELDALRAKQRAQQAQGAIGIVRGMAQAVRGASAADRAEAAASAVPPSGHDQGQDQEQAARGGEEQEVSATKAPPLSESLLSLAALPMAWPAVHVAEEDTEVLQNGSQRQRP